MGGTLAEAEALLARGDSAGALACAMALAQSHPPAWGLVAGLRQAAGDLEAAVDAATRWVTMAPDDGSAWRTLAGVMLAAGQPAQAVVALEQAVERAPGAGVLADLGLALRRAGRPGAARAVLDRAVALEPSARAARLGRASLLSWSGDDAAALLDLDAALADTPDDPGLLGARASALRGLGRVDEALAVLREARTRAPDDARLAWNEALTLLAAGDFRAGLPAYGVRRRRSRQQGARVLPGVPMWTGGSLDGQTLLVHAEQGFGDSLQFVRFAGLLATRGARVVVRGHGRLAALLGQVPGVAVYIAKDTPVPQVDLQVGMMDVPGLLGLDAADLGAAVPYLHADADRVWRLSRRLPAAGLRVGIGWQGNPDFEADHLRSPPLARFAPLASVEGAAFICLQQQHGRDQLARSRLPMLDLAPELDTGPDGFVDTAAVLASLDLVITSDTALAHLAGGMGRPTWVVLPYAADWRWLVARTDVPWYPTMRLFRQPGPGAWEPVFEQVTARLKRVVAGKEAP